ncbi:MAG: hypothetical protein JKY61_09560 [Planctomycetes bacterium]|nr:hypothetical protein [Planctomycetota bacterium]
MLQTTRIVLLLILFAIASGSLNAQDGVRETIPTEVHPDSIGEATLHYGSGFFTNGEAVDARVVFSRRGEGAPKGLEWEVEVVDAETGEPIERATVNTEMTRMCGTGYVAHRFYKSGRGGSIVITGPQGLAQFQGRIAERDRVIVSSEHGLSGGMLRSYGVAILKLPVNRPGQVGRVTVPLFRKPMGGQVAWVTDGVTGKAILGAKVGAVLVQTTEGPEKPDELGEVVAHWLGDTDSRGRVNFQFNLDHCQWLLAEAPGYAPRWFLAYDQKREQKDYKLSDGEGGRPLAVELFRNANLAGQIMIDTTIHRGALSLTAEWNSRDLKDARGSRSYYPWGEIRPQTFHKTIEITANAPFHLQGIPSGIPVRISLNGDSLIHRGLKPLQLEPGENREWNWGAGKGLKLEWVLGDQSSPDCFDPIPDAGVELVAATDEVLGWSQENPRIYGRNRATFPFHANALRAHEVHDHTLTWTGLEPGRYKVSLLGDAETSRGYRSFVFDLNADRSMTWKNVEPVTFKLPAFATQGAPSISVTNAETGSHLWGGPGKAHSSMSTGEIRMLLPEGEYFVCYYSDRYASAFLAGKFSIKPGDVISLLPPAQNKNKICQLRMPRSTQDKSKPERKLIGTLYQHGRAVMPMFGLPIRNVSYKARVLLPVGHYTLKRPDGSELPINVGGDKVFSQELPALDQD